jgi:bla regulator protein BlaR1
MAERERDCMNLKRIGVGIATAVVLATAQTNPTALPEFEVVSIKQTGQTNGQQLSVRLGFQPGGRFVASGITARLLIGVAYSVKDFQIFSGPSWIEREQYSIEAKGAAGRKGPTISVYLTQQQKEEEDFKLRIQSLLADRFQLRIHKETREEVVYSLVVAKNGPKFQKSKFDANGSKGLPGLTMHPNELIGTRVSLRYLAEELSRRLGRNVIDQTGLDGEYDFDLLWTPDAGDGNPPPDGPSVFTALQEQLGLKLESVKAVVDAIVIDHIERPSEN